MLTTGHDLWWRTFQEVGDEYPDIEKDYNHVDACCMWIVKKPEYYDVIVTTNMFGDIITDLSRHHPRRHGHRRRRQHQPRKRREHVRADGRQRPKYTGMGKINPIATINAVSMMLDAARPRQGGDAA